MKLSQNEPLKTKKINVEILIATSVAIATTRITFSQIWRKNAFIFIEINSFHGEKFNIINKLRSLLVVFSNSNEFFKW